MEENKKRDGGVGDIWNGLLGAEYGKQLVDLIKSCTQNPKATGDRIDDSALLIDGTHAFPIQVLLKNEEKRLVFQSITPRFNAEYDNITFEVEKIDEWANGLEGTMEGTIFEGHCFSFYCQNYLAYKKTDLINKKVDINITVVARRGEVLPKAERIIIPDKGPAQGKEFHLDSMRYLNPDSKSDPEMCQFFFPIQGIETIKFWGSEVYKIKGVLSDSDSGKDYFYSVYVHPSLIKDVAELKAGEPFHGWGWLQAQIMGILPS